MLNNIIAKLFGTKHERDLKQLTPMVDKINTHEPWAKELKEEDFPLATAKFKERITNGESLDDILPEAFALVREAAWRTLGERHYDVQLLGGIVLHQGKIMEMKTGEGKTLSSVTAAYLNSLEGQGVHIVTVNDYLASRDAKWMEPVYNYLGINVGAIVADMDNNARIEAYAKDITYGTNNEFGFDYLRDNMRWNIDGKVQKTHRYCIIDEIDSILIDEARTPLIISGQAEDDTSKFTQVNSLIRQLTECAKDPATGDYPEEPVGDYKIDEKGKRTTFTDQGMNRVEEILLNNGLITGSLFSDTNFEYIHYFTQALKAHKLFQKDVDYVVQDGTVQIVDEFTGRILHGRRYSDGQHQAIEAKEGIKVARRNRTMATITFQNFFRMYDKISGMTGTADTEAKEFTSIYGLDVVVIPTNKPIARKDEDDVIFLTEEFKNKAICDEIEQVNKKGQPLLVGTASIEKSELIATLLRKRGIRHEVLNAKNHSREALIIAEAGARGSVTIATNMAGRGTDIKLGGNPEYRARKKAGTGASEEDFRKALDVEKKKWKSDYEEIRELGGLYILGTERHESRRIDNQLRGRAGRQGDPGVSRFFLSLDDDLMRLFARDNVKNLMGRAGMNSGEPLFHPLINRAIERAQSRVEDRNFEIRKHLLEYDDVLNEQRTFIYDQRDTILDNKVLTPRILASAEEIIEETLEGFRDNRNKNKAMAIAELTEKMKVDFFYELPYEEGELEEIAIDSLKDQIVTDFQANIEEKNEKVGVEGFNQFIRDQYLRNIDTRWQEHLAGLEALREAVYLRSYAQKNPLLEYKLEGFQIFDTLIQNIKGELAKKVIKVRIEKNSGSQRQMAPQAMRTNHANIGQFGGQGGGGEPSQANPQGATVKRTLPKVGRNDLCPCGSGKKYKHCHGA